MVKERELEGTRVPPLGVFIRDFLREHGEGYPSGVHQAYKADYRGWKTSKGNFYRLGTYRSHLVYMRGLARMGLIERTGRLEESDDPKVELIAPVEERVYFRLTSKGKRAPDYVWTHPLRLYYRPFDWEYTTYGDYIKR